MSQRDLNKKTSCAPAPKGIPVNAIKLSRKQRSVMIPSLQAPYLVLRIRRTTEQTEEIRTFYLVNTYGIIRLPPETKELGVPCDPPVLPIRSHWEVEVSFTCLYFTLPQILSSSRDGKGGVCELPSRILNVVQDVLPGPAVFSLQSVHVRVQLVIAHQ